MRVRNISKIVLYYVKIHRKHIGKTIVVHNLNQRVMFPERRVESLAVFMLHMDKQSANSYPKDLDLVLQRILRQIVGVTQC